jgi:hypothetical protein
VFYKRFQPTQGIFFVHIPRTGGRFFKELLLVNSFKQKGGSAREDTVDDIPVMHLPVSYLKKNRDYNENPKFCIIRNPYERYKSALRVGEKNIPPSWLVPQVNFIEKDTLIWKYEDGLNKNLCDFIKDKLNITLQYFNPSYTKYNEELNPEKELLTKEQIEFVNKTYEQDFIKLNYCFGK